ncbi:MAG: DUF1624 domain-containing protein [Pelosinus sp.]|nr:DUF1624 domain-containing protein [Pelosinus sp.]
MKPARIREIDVLRTVAILLMVLFHTIVDLTDFLGFSFNYMDGFWYYQGKSSAVLFMLISGISCTLGCHSIKRGLWVLAAGAVIIVATYFFDSATYVRFGILQLLGCSMLSYPLIKRLKPMSISLLALTVLLIYRFMPIYTNTPYFLPIGIMPLNFASIDYYPLFPWYAVFLGGVALGKLLYAKRQPLLPDLPQNKLMLLFEQAGKHSLAIYLLHQPILLAVLYGIHRLFT